MNITTVIPVHGRLPLLERTLRRLREQTVPVNNIVLVGDTDAEFDMAMKHGARFVRCPNFPLGRKWEFGLQDAKKAFPKTEYYFHTGSDEWFTPRYIETMLQEIGKYGMIGMREFIGVHVESNGVITGCFWDGFHQRSRSKEPVGSGRLITRHVLDTLKWEVVNPDLDKNLDLSMCVKLAGIGAKIKAVSIHDPGPANNQRVLAISCDCWKNKRNVNKMLRIGAGTPIKSETLTVFLRSQFREIYDCDFFVKDRLET